MKSSHYMAVAVRLFAIVLFIYSIQQSTILLDALINGSIQGVKVSSAFILTTSIIPLIVGVLLWIFPLTVARAILKGELDKPAEAVDAQSMLTVLILSIGLYTLYYAVVDSVYWLTYWNMASNSNGAMGIGAESKSNMIVTALELMVSISLVLKPRTLSYFMLNIAK